MLLTVANPAANGQNAGEEKFMARARLAALQVSVRSFPEIDAAKIRFKPFESRTTFFKARFSIGRLLTFRSMRHLLYVNPEAESLSDQALEGILAHELAHILYYTEKNQFQLLGLTCLISDKFTAKFERTADLIAIERGYGAGLSEYRLWLYGRLNGRQVTARKRVYLSPAEIALVQDEAVGRRELMEKIKKNVPKNIDELRTIIRNSEK